MTSLSVLVVAEISNITHRRKLAILRVKETTEVLIEKPPPSNVSFSYAVWGRWEIDDSIVRGTTLKHSIIRILDRLGPKKIIVVSSAPQIRYPDCYGIDMAILGDFIAFQAAISLLKEKKMEEVIDSVYKKCKAQIDSPKEEVKNYVKEIYSPFSPEQISSKISEILTPKEVNAEVEIIYQSIEDLHISCPNHTGDWYFTGDYPTPGGNKVVTKAFINFVEGNKSRAY